MHVPGKIMYFYFFSFSICTLHTQTHTDTHTHTHTHIYIYIYMYHIQAIRVLTTMFYVCASVLVHGWACICMDLCHSWVILRRKEDIDFKNIYIYIYIYI